MDHELLKWAIQQGGLALVIILLIYYIKKRDADIQRVLDCNTQAMEANAKSNNNLADAVVEQSRTMEEHTDALKTLLYGIQRKKVGPARFPSIGKNPHG